MSVVGWSVGRSVVSVGRVGRSSVGRSVVSVVQWKEDGSVGVVYPPEYATTEFTLPSWVKE